MNKMKILVTTQGEGGLDDTVSQVFARAPTFTLIEVENKEIKKTEVFRNEAASAFGGAGIQAAQFAAEKGANVIITGSIGPNAANILSTVKIKIVTGFGGVKVRDVVQRYLEGIMPTTSTTPYPPTASRPPFAGRGFGRGGMGKGASFGRGRGFGRGGMGGPIGECVCPNCGYRMPNPPGVPCRSLRCPKCGSVMVKVV